MVIRKAPNTPLEIIYEIGSSDLGQRRRADERTRTAYPCSLLVICSTAERGPQTFLYALARSICWVPSSVSTARNPGSERVDGDQTPGPSMDLPDV
jgi:hypothetical protein